MKKNRCPKLTLNRETLSLLDRTDELTGVVGGATGERTVCGTCPANTCVTCHVVTVCLTTC